MVLSQESSFQLPVHSKVLILEVVQFGCPAAQDLISNVLLG